MLFNKKNHLKFERSSFTLIELLIVIAIIGIMTSISAAAYVAMRNQRQVKVVAEQIKSRIVEAHSYALTPKDDSPPNLKWIRIVINSPSSSPVLYIQEIGDHTHDMPPDALPSSITVSTTPRVCFIANNKDQAGQLDTTTAPLCNVTVDSNFNYSFNIANKNGTVKYKLTVNHITGAVDIKKI